MYWFFWNFSRVLNGQWLDGQRGVTSLAKKMFRLDDRTASVRIRFWRPKLLGQPKPFPKLWPKKLYTFAIDWLITRRCASRGCALIWFIHYKHYCIRQWLEGWNLCSCFIYSLYTVVKIQNCLETFNQIVRKFESSKTNAAIKETEIHGPPEYVLQIELGCPHECFRP